MNDKRTPDDLWGLAQTYRSDLDKRSQLPEHERMAPVESDKIGNIGYEARADATLAEQEIDAGEMKDTPSARDAIAELKTIADEAERLYDELEERREFYETTEKDLLPSDPALQKLVQRRDRLWKEWKSALEAQFDPIETIDHRNAWSAAAGSVIDHLMRTRTN